MGVLPDWGLQIWALTRLAQMVWCSGFLPSIPEEWRAPVEPLESLAGWMPALAPIVPDGNSSWGPMDQLQVMGAANLRNAFPRCALPCHRSDCRGVWPPMGWTTPQSLRDSFILQKKPAVELQMVSNLIKSFVQHKRGGTGQEICPADFAPRVILSINTFTFHLLNSNLSRNIVKDYVSISHECSSGWSFEPIHVWLFNDNGKVALILYIQLGPLPCEEVISWENMESLCNIEECSLSYNSSCCGIGKLPSQRPCSSQPVADPMVVNGDLQSWFIKSFWFLLNDNEMKKKADGKYWNIVLFSLYMACQKVIFCFFCTRLLSICVESN